MIVFWITYYPDDEEIMRRRADDEYVEHIASIWINEMESEKIRIDATVEGWFFEVWTIDYGNKVRITLYKEYPDGGVGGSSLEYVDVWVGIRDKLLRVSLSSLIQHHMKRLERKYIRDTVEMASSIGKAKTEYDALRCSKR